MEKLLGVDYGEQRIGLAVSTEDLKYASRFSTLPNKGISDACRDIQKICKEEGISVIVVGLPKDQQGNIGLKAREVMDFSKQLGAVTGLPIQYEDERFTSIQASRLMRQKGEHEHQYRQTLDQEAARLILQSFLDRTHGTVSIH